MILQRRTVLAWCWLATFGFLAAGLAGSLTTPLAPWVDQLVADHRPLPLAAQLNAMVGDLNWVTPIALGVTLPALLLPDGRLRSRRWRLVAAASVTGTVLILVGGSVAPGPLQDLPIDNPFGLGGVAGRVAWGVAYTGAALHWASLMAALVCVVLRFRASRGTARQQMRWIGAVALQPLRRRIQRTVDRRFNRRRYDATRILDAFAARLRNQVDLDALHVELLSVVDQTMQPTQASLWLRTSTPCGSRDSHSTDSSEDARRSANTRDSRCLDPGGRSSREVRPMAR